MELGPNPWRLLRERGRLARSRRCPADGIPAPLAELRGQNRGRTESWRQAALLFLFDFVQCPFRVSWLRLTPAESKGKKCKYLGLTPRRAFGSRAQRPDFPWTD